MAPVGRKQQTWSQNQTELLKITKKKETNVRWDIFNAAFNGWMAK